MSPGSASPATSSATPALGADPVPVPVAPAGFVERRSTDRRRKPTSVLSRYSFFGGRRKADRRGNATNTYVDLYEPRLAISLVSIGVLCALDAIFTLIYIQRGGEEANPIMDHVITWGPEAFILVKCGVTNFGLAVLCVHKNFTWVRVVIGGLFVAYSALFAYHLYLSAHVG